MLNTDAFIKRLGKLMDYYGLSAATFADKIGVQRSGISHLLSGRNKPSLDFVMKISGEFPEVDLYWLLNGKGNMLKENNVGATENNSSPQPSVISKQTDIKKEITAPLTKTTKGTVNDNTIYKIVIFYKDGTFADFNSSNDKPE